MIRSLVVAILVLWARSVHAQTPDVAASLARIETARAGVRTLEAAFDQDRQMGLFAQVLHAQGRLVVERPNRVRWEIGGSAPGVFTVDGDRVAYRAAGSTGVANQSQVGPLGAVLVDLTAFLGGSLAPLAQRYTIEVAARDGGGLLLTARPHDPRLSAVVAAVRLAFSPNLQVIDVIDIDEPGGDRTHIVTHDARINSGHVSADTFRP